MTKQSMEERLENSEFIVICDCDANDCENRKVLEDIKQFISQEIERARQEVVSEVVEMVNEMSIKDRTTGTPYGLASVIHQLKKKYNLE